MRLLPTAAAFVATLSMLLPVIADSIPANALDGIECKPDWPSESGNYKGPPPGYTGSIPGLLRRRNAGTSIDLRRLFDCSRIGDEKGRERCEAHAEVMASFQISHRLTPVRTYAYSLLIGKKQHHNSHQEESPDSRNGR